MFFILPEYYSYIDEIMEYETLPATKQPCFLNCEWGHHDQARNKLQNARNKLQNAHNKLQKARNKLQNARN